MAKKKAKKRAAKKIRAVTSKKTKSKIALANRRTSKAKSGKRKVKVRVKAVKRVGKLAKAKAKRRKSTLIFVKQTTPAKELERLHQQKIRQVGSISTPDLEKMQAFGVLPFELRQELSKRTGKK